LTRISDVDSIHTEKACKEGQRKEDDGNYGEDHNRLAMIFLFDVGEFVGLEEGFN